MNNKIDFNRYCNHGKVIRITSWIRCFVCDLRKVKKQRTLYEPVLMPIELNETEKLLVKANQFEFHLTDLSDNNSKFRDLNVKLDEEGILRCERCLKFAPILQKRNRLFYQSINTRSLKLIILNIHESNKHISAKYTLNEFRQKFWLLCRRRTARNIIKVCIICGKRHCKSYRYPPSPPPTSLRINNLRPFFTLE